MESVIRQAESLKDRGNLCFQKERYAAAIEAYTEAITLCPDVSTYYTYRALCHEKRNDWERVESDCRKALELDRSSLNACHMLGLALLQIDQCTEAIKQLEKALELARGGQGGLEQKDMVEKIWSEISKAKYAEWEQAAQPRIQKLKDLREICKIALRKSFNKSVGKLIGPKFAEDIDHPNAMGIVPYQPTPEIAELRNAYIEQKQTLIEVFDRASKCDVPSKVPDYLCCKITLDIFRDPVITPSGITYERAALLDYLGKGGCDPVTRVPLLPDQLIPNLAIKESVKSYLAEHGWAYKMS